MLLLVGDPGGSGDVISAVLVFAELEFLFEMVVIYDAPTFGQLVLLLFEFLALNRVLSALTGLIFFRGQFG